MAILAKDLARQIGVSEATLSLVLNRKPGISLKTRERVERMVRELGYEDMLQNAEAPKAAHPEETDFNSRKPNKNISFVLYKDNGKLLGMNSFFPLILDGIEASARKHGYNINIIKMDRSSMNADLKYMEESDCAGFVLFATELHDDHIAEFESLGLPFVIFDNYFLDRDIFSVKVNNEQGTYLAVKHLYENGHRKIGYLRSDLNINSFLERQKCALNAMKGFKLKDSEKYFYTIGYANEHAMEGMNHLLDSTPIEHLPTAFLTDNDLVAIGAMQAIKNHGYRIPEDFSIIGYDDRPICSLVDPKLTTIQLPRDKFGASAVDLLVDQIEHPNTDLITVEVNGKLIKRDSVARPRNSY